MEHSLSLIVFTLLAQMSVGIMCLLALFGSKVSNKSKTQLSFAILGLLAIAALFSLLHLSDPFIAYNAITNITSSWLSAEIATLGAFGASVLAFLFIRKQVVASISALIGVVFVYAMSKVYMVTPVPFWKSCWTFATFLSCAFILGSAAFCSHLLCEAVKEKFYKGLADPILGFLSFACLFRVMSLIGQVMHGAEGKHVQCYIMTHAFCLLFGTFLFFFAQGNLKRLGGDVQCDLDCRCPMKKVSPRIVGLISFLFIFAGELFSRIAFYDMFIKFGQ